MTFKELGLKQEVLDAVASLGFTEPSPIQQEAIPQLLTENRDLVGLAQTGTGKTAAFGLPMVNEVDFDSKKTQGLVICPTRELCIQISKDFQAFSRNFRNANIVPVYGGASIDTQTRQLSRGAQIVVATPGRLVDMIKRKRVDLSQVQFVALDEADEMLNMGFKEDIDGILSNTPDTKKTWLFSATMPREVVRIAKQYMTDPIEITVGTKNATAKNIEHQYFRVNDRDRFDGLKRIIDFEPDMYGVIFCRTRRETAEVAEKLMKNNYSAEPLHGELSQAQRDRVMRSFRKKDIQLLVATDVAARGIDVDDITHVINYNLPDEIESYTHRSGRTARAGKKGVSMLLLNNREAGKLRQIERIINTEIKQAKFPTGEDICKKQLLQLVDKVVAVEVKEDQINQYLSAIEEKFADLSKEEIIKKFVSAEFNKFLSYYERTSDINDTSSASRGGDRDRGRGNDRRRGNDRDRGGRDRDRGRGDRRERSPRGERSERSERSPRGERSDRSSRGDRDNDGGGDNFNRNVDGESTTLFLNVGMKDFSDKGHLIRILCQEGGVAGKNLGRIRMMDSFSFVDVAPKIAGKLLKGINGVEIEGGRKMRAEVSNQ
ncbi:MAG: DEAD/DEAH box helicase [Flavobacteriales bacterium]|jgi:ATP-dependent RNA helicase DeaD|tara:strand:+ start:2439 stop:4247 length:1809 start_codon:yes stop_codon:yes gene_type:complete